MGRVRGMVALVAIALVGVTGCGGSESTPDASNGKTQATCIRQVEKWAANPPDVLDTSTYLARMKVAELSVVECPSAAVWRRVVESIDPAPRYYDWSDPSVRTTELLSNCRAMKALDPPACN